MKIKSLISQNQQQQQARSVPRPKQKEQFMKTKSKVFKAALPLLCGMVAMVISSQGFAQFTQICDLGTLLSCSNGISIAHGVSGNGDVVGSVSAGGFCESHAFSADGKKCPALALVPADDISNPFFGNTFGINGNRVVGVREFPGFPGVLHAFRKGPGPLTDLLTLGGDNSVAYAVNGNKPAKTTLKVVGTSQFAPGPPGHFHAFLHTGTGPLAPANTVDLGTFGGDDSVAYGVNDNSAVVGAAETVSTGNPTFLFGADIHSLKTYLPFGGGGSGNFHAFRYTGPGPLNPALITLGGNDLGTLPGGFNSVAYGVNNNLPVPVVVGTSQDANGDFHAFVHPGPGILASTDDINAAPPAPPFISSAAYAVNNLSEAVGMGEVAPNNFHAFLWLPVTKYGLAPGRHDLNSLPVVVANNWTLIQATGINDNGDIVGTGLHLGQLRAFRLSP